LKVPKFRECRVPHIFKKSYIRTVALKIRFAKHLPDSSCGNSNGAICRTPDFFTTDEYGRQADSFQDYVDADGFRNTGISYSNLESLIRGDEIHLGGDVRIRNVSPSDPDFSSGGWGSIRSSVPYTLSGNVFSHLVPLQLIGDTDGKFSYILMWTEYGGAGGYIYAETVPEPATIFGTFMALGGLAAFQRKNKQLKGLRSRGRSRGGRSPSGRFSEPYSISKLGTIALEIL